MSQSSALIKLTKSEIDYVIIALVHAKESAEHFSQFNYSKSFEKLRYDFVKINEQIIEGEKANDVKNRNEQKISLQTQEDCEACD